MIAYFSNICFNKLTAIKIRAPLVSNNLRQLSYRYVSKHKSLRNASAYSYYNTYTRYAIFKRNKSESSLKKTVLKTHDNTKPEAF